MQDLDSNKRVRDQSFSRLIEVLIYFVVAIHLAANFLASPVVRYSYLAMCILMISASLVLKPSKSIWLFVIFSLYEGQGRVVWGYASWARIIFDACLALSVLKSIIVTKKVWDRTTLPQYINVLITMHFAWFVIEVFNPGGAGIFASIATAKFYIFPLLFFFFCLKSPLDINDIKNQRKIMFILLNMFALAILTIVQEVEKEAFMEAISSNYINLFRKYSLFQDYTFRPWGTSFVPGGMGIFYFMMIGFCFLLKPHIITKKQLNRYIISFLRVLTILLLFYSSFIGEVRSATLKLAGILGVIVILRFLGTKYKFKKVVSLLAILSIGYFFSLRFSNTDLIASLDIEHSIERWTSLADKGITNQRGGLDQALTWVGDRVDSPLGYGLGMTTNFLPAYNTRRKNMVGKTHNDFWNMDNFFVSLFLELGVGAFIFISMLVAIIVALFSMSVRCLRMRKMSEFSVISISAATTLLVFLGNWGATGLVYNPESFFFWFWVAFGFNQYRSLSDFVGDDVTHK